MRALFGLVGLLAAVVVVVMLATTQLQAVAPSAAPLPTAPVPGTTPTVQEHSRGVQQKVLQEVGSALEQGAARSGDSQP